jgi:Mn2+/Fe2+ NRAMP family transporter
VVYTLARLALFLAVTAVLYVLGARGIVLFVLAALASGLLSLPLLARQRAAVAAELGERPDRRRRPSRLDSEAAAEDD